MRGSVAGIKGLVTNQTGKVGRMRVIGIATRGAVTVAGSCAAVAASVAVVSAAAAVANSDIAADDAAAAVAAAVTASTAELMSCLHLACPCYARLGLFRHTRCPDHSSTQPKQRVLFRLSSPFP